MGLRDLRGVSKGLGCSPKSLRAFHGALGAAWRFQMLIKEAPGGPKGTSGDLRDVSEFFEGTSELLLRRFQRSSRGSPGRLRESHENSGAYNGVSGGFRAQRRINGYQEVPSQGRFGGFPGISGR